MSLSLSSVSVLKPFPRFAAQPNMLSEPSLEAGLGQVKGYFAQQMPEIAPLLSFQVMPEDPSCIYAFVRSGYFYQVLNVLHQEAPKGLKPVKETDNEFKVDDFTIVFSPPMIQHVPADIQEAVYVLQDIFDYYHISAVAWIPPNDPNNIAVGASRQEQVQVSRELRNLSQIRPLIRPLEAFPCFDFGRFALQVGPLPRMTPAEFRTQNPGLFPQLPKRTSEK